LKRTLIYCSAGEFLLRCFSNPSLCFYYLELFQKSSKLNRENTRLYQSHERGFQGNLEAKTVVTVEEQWQQANSTNMLEDDEGEICLKMMKVDVQGKKRFWNIVMQAFLINVWLVGWMLGAIWGRLVACLTLVYCHHVY